MMVSTAKPTDAVEELVEKWGYAQIMPENEIQWPEIPYWVHILVGTVLLIQGRHCCFYSSLLQ